MKTTLNSKGFALMEGIIVITIIVLVFMTGFMAGSAMEKWKQKKAAVSESK